MALTNILGTSSTVWGGVEPGVLSAPPTPPAPAGPLMSLYKPYIAHLYDSMGNFKSLLGPLLTRPILKWSLNGGGHPITLDLPAQPTGALAPVQGDIVKLTEQGGTGSVGYTGIVEDVPDDLDVTVAHQLLLSPLIVELGDGAFDKNYSPPISPAGFVATVSSIDSPMTGYGTGGEVNYQLTTVSWDFNALIGYEFRTVQPDGVTRSGGIGIVKRNWAGRVVVEYAPWAGGLNPAPAVGDTVTIGRTATPGVDIAQFVRDAVLQTKHLTTTPQSCPQTGIFASFNFSKTNPLRALEEAVKIGGTNFYFFVDEVGVVWFGQSNQGTIAGDGGMLSSVSAAGAVLTLTDGSRGWVTNQWVGYQLYSPFIYSATVTSNTATVLTSTNYVPYVTAGTYSVSYWNNVNFSGSPAYTTTTPAAIDGGIPYWSSANGSAGQPGVTSLDWSARYTNTITVAVDGTYYFAVYSDDGARVNVNGINVIESFVGTAVALRIGSIALKAGTYPLIIEYFESFGPPATLVMSIGYGRPNVNNGLPIGSPNQFYSYLLTSTKPATYTVKEGIDYVTRKYRSPITDLRNYILGIGAFPLNKTSPIIATYDNGTLHNTYMGPISAGASQYGVRALVPPLTFPEVADQATLNKIIYTIGTALNQRITTVEIVLQQFSPISLKTTGGCTLRYWEPNQFNIVQSESGSGTYSPIYTILDIEQDGPIQKVIVGTTPMTVNDIKYMMDRMQQNTAQLAITAINAGGGSGGSGISSGGIGLGGGGLSNDLPVRTG